MINSKLYIGPDLLFEVLWLGIYIQGILGKHLKDTNDKFIFQSL